MKRSKIVIPDPDVPTKFDGPNEVISGDNQYIQFNGSSVKKDVSRICGDKKNWNQIKNKLAGKKVTTYINFSNGKLDSNTSIWIGNNETMFKN